MLKTFIIAAQTADGFIAKDSNDPSFKWTSKEDKRRFMEITKRAGIVVMGSATYKTFGRPLKERLNIVYSRHEQFPDVEMTQDDPKALLTKLDERFKGQSKEVAICGGTQIYTMFMRAGLVDKIYLTIEPVLFEKGLTLFADGFEPKMTLVKEEKTEGGTIFREYNVDR